LHSEGAFHCLKLIVNFFLYVINEPLPDNEINPGGFRLNSQNQCGDIPQFQSVVFMFSRSV